MTRNENQALFKKTFKYDFNAIGVGILPTSYGKTKCALDICEDLNKIVKNQKIDVIVPSKILKKQWERLITERKINNITLWIINSYVKLKSYNSDFLIIDEIHKVCNIESNWFKRAIEITTFKRFLGLSGTLEEKHLNFLKEKGIPIVIEVSRKEAIDNGWIANYSMYTLMLEMDEVDKKKYDNLCSISRSAFSLFPGKNSYNALLKCIANKEYATQIANHYKLEVGSVIGRCLKAQKASTERKYLIQNYYKKNNITLDIVKQFPLKTIIFGKSIKFAKEIAKSINEKEGKIIALSVTSDKEDIKDNESSLKKLKDNRYNIRVISSAKALNEGLDIPDLQLGIDVAYDSSKVSQGQRLGRFLRLCGDKKAIYINICMKDTKEEDWLKANTGLQNSKIVDSIEEIIEYENNFQELEIQ